MVSLVGSLAIALAAGVPTWALILQSVILISVAGFIVTRPAIG